MADAYVQVATDGAGKRIANFPVTLPVGTIVVDADGTQTALSAATTVYLQRVVLTDTRGVAVDRFFDEDWQSKMLDEQRCIRRLLQKLNGDLPTAEPSEV